HLPLPVFSLHLFSCSPRAPRATYSPCPTLFRSVMLSRTLASNRNASCDTYATSRGSSDLANVRRSRPSRVILPVLGSQSTGRITDRKSTRLNSSHEKISYAVVCLKNKIYNQQRH